MSGSHQNGSPYEIGYRKPPEHTRFQKGVSGNPSGRPKGGQNLKTLFQKIMREEVSLREGSVTKTITKGEAVVRGLVIGAMKGDGRSVIALMKLAEYAGEFHDPDASKTEVVVRWFSEGPRPDQAGGRHIPGISHINRE